MSETEVKLDVSDADNTVGKRVGGGLLRDPCNGTDNPPLGGGNGLSDPIHWDDKFVG